MTAKASLEADFHLRQQKVVLAVDLPSRTLSGFVEIVLIPARSDARQVVLNAHQLNIQKVQINEVQAVYSIKNLLDAPVPPNASPADTKTFKSFYKGAILAAENGELTIEIPPGLRPNAAGNFVVRVDYSVTDSAGVNFVLPSKENLHRVPHAYSLSTFPGVRSWMPCIDRLHARGHWELFFTVNDPSLTVVATGEMVRMTEQPQGKTFQFFLPGQRVLASSIMFAVGPFERIDTTFSFGEEAQVANLRSSAALLNLNSSAGSSLAPPNAKSNQVSVSYFCLPGRLNELQQTTKFLSNAQKFLSNFLDAPFPFKTYKQVFVEESYCKISFGTEISILSSSLLHSDEVIDQTFASRRLQIISLASQWFGCFATAYEWADMWLIFGMVGYLALTFCQKMFGGNEVKRQLKRMMDYVCFHPNNQPLYATNVICPQELFSPLFYRKSTLVFYLMEKKIGTPAIRKVLNNLLQLDVEDKTQSLPILATHVVLKRIKKHTGTDLLAFFNEWVLFDRFFTNCPHFNVGFWYDSVQNDLEVAIKTTWPMPPPEDHILGVNLRIVELDPNAPPPPSNISKKLYNPTLAFYEQQLSIESQYFVKTFACKNRHGLVKQSSLPLTEGEENEKKAVPTHSPVLWVRLDPTISLMASISIKQPEHLWRQQLLYDRDVVSQMEALQNISAYGKGDDGFTMPALYQIITDKEQYYRVRMRAAYTYATLISRTKNWEAMGQLINYFKKEFFDSIPATKGAQLVKPNDFSDFSLYYLQKAIPYALSLIEIAQPVFDASSPPSFTTPSEVVRFIQHLLRANDNSQNDYLDNYYLAAILRAAGNIKIRDPLSELEVEKAKEGNSDAISNPHVKVLAQLFHYLKLERTMPSYHNTVCVAVLESLAKWQGRSHINLKLDFFFNYTSSGNFRAVRLAAVRALIHLSMDSYPKNEKLTVEVLSRIFDLFEKEALSGAWFRYQILNTLTSDPIQLLEATSDSSWDSESVASAVSPPYDSPAAYHEQLKKRLNYRFLGFIKETPETSKLRERVWAFINSPFSGSDARLRFALLDVYDRIGGSSFTPYSPIPPLMQKPTKPPEIIKMEKEFEASGVIKKRRERTYEQREPLPKRVRTEPPPAPMENLRVRLPSSKVAQSDEIYDDAMDIDAPQPIEAPKPKPPKPVAPVDLAPPRISQALPQSTPIIKKEVKREPMRKERELSSYEVSDERSDKKRSRQRKIRDDDFSDLDAELDILGGAPPIKRARSSVIPQVPVPVAPPTPLYPVRTPLTNPDDLIIYIRPPVTDAPIFPKLLKISAYSRAAGYSIPPPVKVIFTQ